jgi:hypothetical protein
MAGSCILLITISNSSFLKNNIKLFEKGGLFYEKYQDRMKTKISGRAKLGEILQNSYL